MAKLEEAWKWQERWATSPHCESAAACLLELRARVEALEQRAAAPAPEPVPAPAADRPLWAQMEAVADWLEVLGCYGHASALRTALSEPADGPAVQSRGPAAVTSEASPPDA